VQWKWKLKTEPTKVIFVQKTCYGWLRSDPDRTQRNETFAKRLRCPPLGTSPPQLLHVPYVRHSLRPTTYPHNTNIECTQQHAHNNIECMLFVIHMHIAWTHAHVICHWCKSCEHAHVICYWHANHVNTRTCNMLLTCKSCEHTHM